MKVSRGKMHEYLGMTLDFTDKGKVKVDMVEYTKSIIDDFLEVISGGAATKAAKHMLEID